MKHLGTVPGMMLAILISASAAQADSSEVGLTRPTHYAREGNRVAVYDPLPSEGEIVTSRDREATDSSPAFLAAQDNSFVTISTQFAGPANGSPVALTHTTVVSPGTARENSFNSVAIPRANDGIFFHPVGSRRIDCEVAVAPEPGMLVLLVSGLGGAAFKRLF